jgi:hypothetical protein
MLRPMRDRAQLAAGDRLVELVAPDPQDRRGLAGGEHLGQDGQRARGGAGKDERRSRGGGQRGVRAVARIGGRWPLLLLDGWCGGRPRPVCPAVGGGGGGPYLDPAPWCGVFPWWEGLSSSYWPGGEGEERAAGFSRW